MIINGVDTGIDPLVAQFSAAANPGLLAKYLESKAPVRGTETSPWADVTSETPVAKETEGGKGYIEAQSAPSQAVSSNRESKSLQNAAGYGKAGLNVGLGLAKADPGIGMLANGAYDLASGNPNAANNLGSGLLGYGTRAGLTAALGAVPGLGIPASIASEMAQRNPDYKGAAARGIGGTAGAAIGSIAGPAGALLGSMIGSSILGKSVTEGFIGDALNTRSGEKIREDIEKTGSYKDSGSFMREMDNRMMANSYGGKRGGLGGWIADMFDGGGKGSDNNGPDGTADSGPESASSDDGETMAA